MNPAAQAVDRERAALGGPSYYNESPEQRAQMARAPQMNNQLAHANFGTNLNGGGNGMFAQDSGIQYNMPTTGAQGVGGAGATIPSGNPAEGNFRPVTFRSGTGTATAGPDGLETSLSSPYAGLSDLVGTGQGLLGQAGEQAQRPADQFSYNFDPEGRSQQLFDQRSALLAPQFAQQRAMNNEGMFNSGRSGLRISGDMAGAGGGMVQPDAFGMNRAQSQALAGLAAQSTNDAFGQQMQQAGLDLSQFGANQGQQQQRYQNLMGTGAGMLSGGFQGAGLENQLAGIGLQGQGMNQNYDLGRRGLDIQQMQMEQGNYQPNSWLTGLTSLGGSFLGTEAGGNWLSGLF